MGVYFVSLFSMLSLNIRNFALMDKMSGENAYGSAMIYKENDHIATTLQVNISEMDKLC